MVIDDRVPKVQERPRVAIVSFEELESVVIWRRYIRMQVDPEVGRRQDGLRGSAAATSDSAPSERADEEVAPGDHSRDPVNS